MTEREEKWPDMFSMSGLQIIKNSTSKDNEDGTTSFSLSFPVCEVSDYLEQPEVILEIMNVGAHPYAKAAPALYEALDQQKWLHDAVAAFLKFMRETAAEDDPEGMTDHLRNLSSMSYEANKRRNKALSQARGETGEEG